MAVASGPGTRGPWDSPGTAPPGPPRLAKSSTDRILCGVAGGLGRYFGVDPVVFRIGFVVVCFVGPGVLVYLAACLLMPRDDRPGAPPVVARGRGAVPVLGPRRGRQRVLAWVLLGIGTIFVVDNLSLWGGRDLGLPLLLIALGVAVLLWRRDEGDEDDLLGDPGDEYGHRWQAGAWDGDPGYGPEPVGAPWAGPGWAGAWATRWGAPDDEDDDDDEDDQPVDRAEEDGDGEHGDGDPLLAEAARLRRDGYLRDEPPAGPLPPEFFEPAPAPAPRPVEVVAAPGAPVTAVTLGLLLVLSGAVVALDLAGVTGFGAHGFLVLALGLTGLALVVGARLARPRGLIPVGLVLSALLAVAGLVGAVVPLDGSVGEHRLELAAADLPTRYELLAGDLTVDLSAVAVPPGERPELHVRLGAGQVVVLVPADAAVEARVELAVGEALVFGDRHSGVGVEAEGNNGPAHADEGALVVTVEGGAGEVTVTEVAPAASEDATAPPPVAATSTTAPSPEPTR